MYSFIYLGCFLNKHMISPSSQSRRDAQRLGENSEEAPHFLAGQAHGFQLIRIIPTAYGHFERKDSDRWTNGFDAVLLKIPDKPWETPLAQWKARPSYQAYERSCVLHQEVWADLPWKDEAEIY